MKKYKLAIFDLDGTLLDTLQDLANSTNYALRTMGYPLRRVDEIRSFVGNGVKKLIERAVPKEASETQIEKTLSIFKTHYAEHCEEGTRPYHGIIDLLDHLIDNDITIAVVSNKIDTAVTVLCKKYFGDRIVISVGDRDGIRKKPFPDSVFEVLNALRIKKENAVYIGDSEVDIQTAKNAKMDCISVKWGFRDEDVLCNEWGFEKHEKTLFLTEKKGIPYGNGLAYFAHTPENIEDLLLLKKESVFS